jgi:hypothetical protein
MVKTLVLSMALLIINEPLLIMNVNICDVAEAKQHSSMFFSFSYITYVNRKELKDDA